jgi:hypothetical protein
MIYIPSQHSHDVCKMRLRTRFRGAARSESHLMLQIFEEIGCRIQREFVAIQMVVQLARVQILWPPPPPQRITATLHWDLSHRG